MKTVLLLLFVALLLALLCACGGSDPADDGPDESALPVTCAPAGCAK